MSLFLTLNSKRSRHLFLAGVLPLVLILPQPAYAESAADALDSEEQIQESGSQVEQWSRGEAIYKDKLNHLMEGLKDLPQLCEGSSSLSDKTKRFQKKLNEMKEEALELRLLKEEYRIGFLHPLDKMFSLSAFVVYVYEDRFFYNFEIPSEEKELKKRLKYLSEGFQHLYRANFGDPSARIEDFPFWAKHIALTLDCLSE